MESVKYFEMKHLLTILILLGFMSVTTAETYVCKDGPPLELSYSLKRAEPPFENEIFIYKSKEYETNYSLIEETDKYLYLMNNRGKGSTFSMIDKDNLTISAVWLEYKNSSDSFYGECFTLD